MFSSLGVCDLLPLPGIINPQFLRVSRIYDVMRDKRHSTERRRVCLLASLLRTAPSRRSVACCTSIYFFGELFILLWCVFIVDSAKVSTL